MILKIPEKFSPDSSFEDLLSNCTEKIGCGSNRDVFKIPEHDDKVLKVSSGPGNFSNWCEIIAYSQHGETGDLADIFSWSWSGKFLIMEKLTPVTKVEFDSYDYPDYLTDRKQTNLGSDTEGNVKALDFGALKLQNRIRNQFI